MRRELRLARATLASTAALAARNPDDPAAHAAVIEQRRAYRAIALEDQLHRALAEEPVLTPAQRHHLASLLLTAEVADVDA
jgi:Spy/CpxP family protein refolding chaperone